MKLGEYIEKTGISAYRFAELSGVHFTNIYRYLKGRTPRGDNLKKILEATNGKVTIDELGCEAITRIVVRRKNSARTGPKKRGTK